MHRAHLVSDPTQSSCCICSPLHLDCKHLILGIAFLSGYKRYQVEAGSCPAILSNLYFIALLVSLFNWFNPLQWEMEKHGSEYATVLFKVYFQPTTYDFNQQTCLLLILAGLIAGPQWVPVKQVLAGTLGQRTLPLPTPTRRWPWGVTSAWTSRGSGRSRKWRSRWTSPSCTSTLHPFNLWKKAAFSRWLLDTFPFVFPFCLFDFKFAPLLLW